MARYVTNEGGFTLVEIGVVVPILMVIAITIFSLMYSYLLSSNREQIRLKQTYERSEALDRIEADVTVSASFLEAEDSGLTDPYQSFSSGGGSSSWTFSGNGSANGNNNDSVNHRVLILREYATTNNPLSSTRQPVYKKLSTASNCTLGSNISTPLTYDVIYFVYNSILYKRIATNPTSLVCAQQYEKVSCPPTSVLNSGNRDSSCAADDEVVASNVSGFTVDYYSNQAAPNPLNAYSTTGQVANAKSVNVTIVTTTPSYGGHVTSQSSLQASSQNGGS